MGFFDQYHREISRYLDLKRSQGKITETFHQREVCWPSVPGRNLVLNSDTAVELGNPGDASSSFLFWVDDPTLLENHRITVIGPDLPDINEGRVSFGKIVLIGGNDFDSENSYDRYRELEGLRYAVNLKGYMMRAVSQFQREWSRVSHEAIRDGLSFQILGSALIDAYTRLEYVKSVEVIFITSSRSDVEEVQPVADGVTRIISAMTDITEEMPLDCDECEYTEVCDDVSELRSMHKSKRKNEGITND